jgi:hypothetical protein
VVTDVLEQPVNPNFMGQAVLFNQDLMPGKLPQAIILMRCVQEMSVLDLGSRLNTMNQALHGFYNVSKQILK